jgi:hypothetical protein
LNSWNSNVSRCKENGIPNIFCILPRRGREHDFPWITFRITCTSTAKHWKGTLFWIGAEYLLDPTQGTLTKYFSPPIHVQSKVKSKEIERTASKGEILRPPVAADNTVPVPLPPPQAANSFTSPSLTPSPITATINALAAPMGNTITAWANGTNPHAPGTPATAPATQAAPPANVISINLSPNTSTAGPVVMPPPPPAPSHTPVNIPIVSASTVPPLGTPPSATGPVLSTPGTPTKTVSLVQSSGTNSIFTQLRTSSS